MKDPGGNGDVRYAGFADRAAAAVLDLIIVGTLYYYLIREMVPLGQIIAPVLFSGLSVVTGDPAMAVVLGMGLACIFLWVLLSWVYSAGVTISPYGGTFGKVIMGMRVVDTSGNPLTFVQASVRYFAKILSTLLAGAGLFLILFSGTRQGLHDRVAGTLVVYKAAAGAPVPAGAGPDATATLARQQEAREESSRSSVKKALAIAVVPLIALFLLFAVVILVVVAAGFASHAAPDYRVDVTVAKHADSGSFTIMYHGGPDAGSLEALDVKINGRDEPRWISPEAGGEREFASATPGSDHVMVTGTFRDGTEQLVFESYI